MAINANPKSKGFTLVEMLMYAGILAIILIVIFNIILSFMNSYRTLSALSSMESSATTAMERLTRDIRNSTSATVSGMGSSTLTLVSETGVNTQFYLQGETLHVGVNNVDLGPLTASTVNVTGLTFNVLNSTNSKAVKIDLTLESTSGTAVQTKNYHDTIILKGS